MYILFCFIEGVVYLDECPYDYWIPIYLIGLGVLGILQHILIWLCGLSCIDKVDHGSCTGNLCLVIGCTTVGTLFAWMMLG